MVFNAPIKLLSIKKKKKHLQQFAQLRSCMVCLSEEFTVTEPDGL